MDDAEIVFIGENVEVFFITEPAYKKTPPCPDGFIWRGESFKVVRLIEAWSSFERKGRMARNMQPQHASRATKKGSWGVGRFSFQVETTGCRVFDLYYDRAPKDADDRQGKWVLFCERVQ